jgi:hypothetical protein
VMVVVKYICLVESGWLLCKSDARLGNPTRSK